MYSGAGTGFGDGIADNERRGMKHFLFYRNGNNPIDGEPTTPLHFYNYMNGVWKNVKCWLRGRRCYMPASGANLDIEAGLHVSGRF